MSELPNVPDSIKEDIINYLSGSLSKERGEQLMLWLNGDKERMAFFDGVTDIWHSSSTIRPQEKFTSETAWDEISKVLQKREKEPIPIRRNMVPILKIAAAVLLILMTGFGAMSVYFSRKYQSDQSQFAEIVAPRGSKLFATLPDGTRLWLNSGSRIKFYKNFGQKTREISLDGEAYFQVAKNKAVPFIVHTSELNITALGTAFNVKAYGDEPIIGTTLDEGSIKIEPCHLTDKSSSLILKPTQSATYAKSTTQVTIHELVEKHGEKELVEHRITVPPKKLILRKPIDPRIFTSWKETKWIFRHEQLDDLAKKLERRYDVNFIFENEQLKEYSFTGTLKDESIDQVLEMIRLVAPISYKINHKTIELSLDKKLEVKYGKAINFGFNKGLYND